MKLLEGIQKQNILLTKPTVLAYVKEVDSLDQFQKTKIFLDRHITDLFLTLTGSKYPTQTFEEFISTDNVEIRDMGEDWSKFQFAQRYDHVYFGIYDWYWKFKHRINL